MLHTLKRFLTITLVGLCLALSAGAATLPVGKSDFSFADPRSNPDKPITAWCYVPAGATRDSRVLFVMTGVNRNAGDYRNNWIRHADKYNFILVVPEFSRRYYGRDDDYSFAGVTQADPQTWGFNTIERLFDEIRRRGELSAEKYSIYGHSAGAQFTHRLMLFTGASARVDMAVSANAGWYTLPVYPNESPFGFPAVLDPGIVPESALPRLFTNRLVVLLGDRDTDSMSRNLNRSGPAMAQGSYRFARGHYFFRTAQEKAAALGVPFNWKLQVVPGVGHSDTGMSGTAAKILFED